MPANKDIPRIPPSEVTRVTKTFHGKDYKVQWRGLPIVVKKLLSPAETMSICSDINNFCTYGDDNDIAYSLLDLSFRINTIKYFTNIDLPTGIDEINFILYETDLFDTVTSHVNKDQIKAIMKAVGLE